MSTSTEKDQSNARKAKINKVVKISSILFVIALVFHLYLAVGNWGFITSFFSTDPIPWIMLSFVFIIIYFAYTTYIYFRKHL